MLIMMKKKSENIHHLINLALFVSREKQSLAHYIINNYTNDYVFFCCSTDGTESPILAEAEAEGHNSDKPRIRYGELVILG